ncbi:hypothetical protein ACFXPZ_38600 [Streptomyces sp. NPDC059101]|uniref:hypothetical protein n=1 Tax=Streptomyces sp. NPDC059101 TaxID=3346728 RepID=UPI0036D0EB4C
MRTEELQAEKIREITQQIVDIVTSPQFVEAVRAVSSAPEDQRLLEGSRRLSPQALRQQGIELPDGMRMSSRYFEEGLLPSPVEYGDGPDGTLNITNSLNADEPGALDRLRVHDPKLFRKLLDLTDKEYLNFSRHPGFFGFCSCAGKKGTCTGIGGGLLEK